MTEADQDLQMPIALHRPCSSEDLVGQLKQELESEREKNWQLSRELLQEKQKNTQLEGYLSGIIQPAKGMPRVQSWSSIASTAPEEETKIGAYPLHIRQQKIAKYKEKIKKYKQKVHLSREFKGRSQVAKSKPRVRGKFVKRDN